jgi:hypothetical protein
LAELTRQTISRAGLDPTYATAAGGGDTVRVGPNLFLHVKNGDASPHTVTVVTPNTYEGLAVADLAVTVPATDERMIGPIGDVFRGANGLASITYDGVTSVTIAALRV